MRYYKTTRLERFLIWLTVLEPGSRLVRVRSWMPWFDFPHGVSWPVVQVNRMGLRETRVPLWNWSRIRSFLFGSKEST